MEFGNDPTNEPAANFLWPSCDLNFVMRLAMRGSTSASSSWKVSLFMWRYWKHLVTSLSASSGSRVVSAPNFALCRMYCFTHAECCRFRLLLAIKTEAALKLTTINEVHVPITSFTSIADMERWCQYKSGHTRHLWRQQRTIFERVRDMLSTRLRHAYDVLSTCLQPVHARHASLRPGFRPGFWPARLMEFGFICACIFMFIHTIKMTLSHIWKVTRSVCDVCVKESSVFYECEVNGPLSWPEDCTFSRRSTFIRWL